MMALVEIMARSVGARPQQNKNCDVEYLMAVESLERFAELVCADERNSWPAEMEAMERQVNILTDALAQAMADEREACMNALNALPYQRSTKYDCMDAIRARGQA